MFKTLFEKAEETENGKLPYPVQIICDDFATGCKVPNFQELISIFREKRIGVTLLIQSESQLDAMYERRNAITIVNNCDTYVYLGGMDLKTCESISKRIDIPCNEVLNMPIGKEYVFRRGQGPIITERYSLRGENQTKNIAR
jgi:type IV secretory pathway TraG/TraD family ATPase VirD4